MLVMNQIKHFFIQSGRILINSLYVENLDIEIEMYIRLYGSCGTDLGRSIAEVTDNIHSIGVV